MFVCISISHYWKIFILPLAPQPPPTMVILTLSSSLVPRVWKKQSSPSHSTRNRLFCLRFTCRINSTLERRLLNTLLEGVVDRGFPESRRAAETGAVIDHAFE